jgi:hypothetical protein
VKKPTKKIMIDSPLAIKHHFDSQPVTSGLPSTPEISLHRAN